MPRRKTTSQSTSSKRVRYSTRAKSCAASRIQRAWRAKRSRRRAGMNRIGVTGRVTKTKVNQSVTRTNTQMSTRTLYQDPLIQIGSGTATNQREKDIVYISGFRIVTEWNCVLQYAMFCNMAIVFDKRAAPGDTSIDQTDFFRALGRNAERANSFNDYANQNSLSYHLNPLNADRFTVLKHFRFQLGGINNTGGYNTQTMNNWRMMKFWIPLKKKVVWEDGALQSQIFLLQWVDRCSDGFTVTPIANAVQLNTNVSVYFKEVMK